MPRTADPGDRAKELHSGAASGSRGALTTDEAARYLGMSRSWLEHSDVPRVKLGRAVRYRVVDLDLYLAQRCDLDVAS